MQVFKAGLFLVLGIAAAACGGGSDGGGDGDGDSGGSSNGGSSSGKGGSSNGGSASGKGGSSSGTGGTGGIGIDTTCSMAGYVSILTVPECKDFYTCYIEALCMESGGGQMCVSQTLTIVKQTACYPSEAGVNLEMACEQARQSLAAQYPQCAD
ncbi:MAG TPA: hypothetical protein VMS65_03385 [Polyangiaceae bacterium]|nr:hypothetical protein [Polyangiaceae bacterium]